jgi:K+-sensing histidine kinase KdpD
MPATKDRAEKVDQAQVSRCWSSPPTSTLLERVLPGINTNGHLQNGPGTTDTVCPLTRRVGPRVIDFGQGIAAADNEQVFQPFQRLRDADSAADPGLCPRAVP